MNLSTRAIHIDTFQFTTTAGRLLDYPIVYSLDVCLSRCVVDHSLDFVRCTAVK